MKKGLRVLSLVMAVVMALMLAVGCSGAKDAKKNITVSVVYEDKTQDDFKISTDKEVLGDALLDEKLISEEEHDSGFVTVVNGIAADYDKDQAWWMLLDKDGNMTQTGISDTKIQDGDSFSFVYTIG